MLDRSRYDAALSEIESGKFYEGFSSVVEVYNDADEDERTVIVAMLKDVFYAPNVDALRKNYENNRAALKDYPYWLGPEIPEFNSLGDIVFPADENRCFILNRQNNEFTKIEVNANRETKYFFKDLSKQLYVENETNEYNLRFLYDNVRASEDVAMDNHIYLYYEKPELFFSVMQAVDLVPLLDRSKFVFMLGPKNKSYPINFKKRYGIDYSKMKAQPLRMDELNRLCFWYKHPHSGSVFTRQVLDESSYIIARDGHDFHTYSRFNGLFLLRPCIQTLGGTDTRITWDMLDGWFNSPDVVIKPDVLRDDYKKFKETFGNIEYFTPADLFRAYFLIQTPPEKQRGRIVPIIFYDPHIWDPGIYDEIFKTFRYITVLTSMREPIMTFARGFEIGLTVWNEFQTKYILASEYAHTNFLNADFLEKYYGFRFEDLKLKPDKMLPVICRLLNVPYEKKMLRAEAPMYIISSGETVRGFETTALTRDISRTLSTFDIVRLQIFYEPIHKYYGYARFDSEEYDLLRSDVEALFAYPFRFERYAAEAYSTYDVTAEKLREWLYDTLVRGYAQGKAGAITFPKLLKPEEDAVE